jgi:GntR family transcriptional regulator
MPERADTPGVDHAYRAVLERLRSGAIPAGSRLPGERTLAADLGVSRSSLRAALALLASEKWLESSYKRGWFVRADAVGEPPNTLISFTEMAAARGATAQSSVLDRVVRPSTFDEAAELGIVPSEPVIEITRVRSMDHVPICLDRTILPRTLAPGLETEELADQSLFAVLGERYGLQASQSAYTVGAELMDERTALLLDVSPGSAALVAHEVVSTAAGVRFMLALITYRGGAYRFTANLYR